MGIPQTQGGLWGRGAHRKAQPSPQTCGGKQTCPLLHPSSHGRPQQGRSTRLWLGTLWPRELERVGWGFLQAQVHLRDSAPRHASDVSSLYYREQAGSRAECLAIHARVSRPALGKPCTPPGLLPLSLWLKQAHTWMLVVLHKAGTHLDADSLA